MIKNLKSFFTKATSAIVFTAATCLCEPAQATTTQVEVLACIEIDCSEIPANATVMHNMTSCVDEEASYKCYREKEKPNGISITVYHKVASCTSCPDYATTVEKVYTECPTMFPALTYTQCGCGDKCDSCNTGTGDWIGSGTYCDILSEICPEATPIAGYEGQGIKTCGLQTQCTCTRRSNYRCAKGYYGSSVQCNKTTSRPYCSGCTTCGTNATTAAAGASTIVQCYIPANVNITDDTGTYHFKADCQYSM